PDVRRIRANAFDLLADYQGEHALRDGIEDVAARVEAGIERFLRQMGIDLLIVHNLWALPMNLPATIGSWRAVQRLNLPALAHSHDFYWEKDNYHHPTCQLVRDLLARYYPPRGPRVTHIVINRLAQAELRHRGVTATVVPNVFDFDTPLVRDEFNSRLLDAMDLSPSDVIFLQATRVVPRKGIEIAVELLALLAAPKHAAALARRAGTHGGGPRARPVLLLPNLVEDLAYFEALQDRIGERGVDARFVSAWVAAQRGAEQFSLWDTYLYADFVTYPSLQEGWGNQFLEAVWARRPVALFEYPVFCSDILAAEFRYVSLGRTFERDANGLARVPDQVLRRAAGEVAELLASPARYQKATDHNFTVGKANFSLDALTEYLNRLVAAALA
ncbi:MAG: hypothetical protein ABID40_05450, partial [Candidatus Bipolaricaulota bacterium]